MFTYMPRACLSFLSMTTSGNKSHPEISLCDYTRASTYTHMHKRTLDCVHSFVCVCVRACERARSLSRLLSLSLSLSFFLSRTRALFL